MSSPFVCPKTDTRGCEMATPIVTNRVHFEPITEVLVTIEWYEPRPIPNPSKAELDSCPTTFRCFCCYERKGKKRHFGGLILDMRICRECYPYLDEATVSGIIRFDMRRGVKVD